jgi:phosphoribosylamine---glycine ligase
VKRVRYNNAMKKYSVLVIGGGGRESALVHKYSQSKKVGRIFAVPGNDLMQEVSRVPVKIYPKIKTTDISKILKICKNESIDLVDVAIDAAVEAGVADEVEKLGILAVGPSRLAGQIEWDKAWARNFMRKYRIPQPKFEIFDSQSKGIAYIKKQKEGKWFVKANGLVDGKGALAAENRLHAIERIKEMTRFANMGKTYLIEDWLVGEEFSLFALCDGNSYQIVRSAQDHKRMFNFDEGENTGGMGCVTPPLLLTSKLLKEIDRQIIKKMIEGLKRENRPFKGVLYLGGIIVKGKPVVIEFNARWGDPEAEVIIPGIKNDFFELGLAIAQGKLPTVKVQTDMKCRVAVAFTLRLNPTPGTEVFGLDKARKIPGVTVYNSRVRKKGKRYFAQSGRQLFVVGEGKDVIEAREKAYRAASLIYMDGNNLHYRTDIGWRDVERLNKGNSPK